MGTVTIKLLLIFFCKAQGVGIIEAVTPDMLENSIPYLNKEELTDKLLKKTQMEKESLCEKT